jgi:flagellin
MATQGTVGSTEAFNAYTNYTVNVLNLNSVMRRLAQGTKSVVDDGAGVAMSERMRSQAGSSNMAMHNTENAISMLQTADTWLQQVSDLLARMHELAVSALDGTKTDQDKANVQTEFGALQEEITRITENAAKFNGQMLFNNAFASGATVQVGADSGQTITITLADLTQAAFTTIDGNALGWASILMSDQGTSVTQNASAAITNLQHAVNHVATLRASIGAQQGRFEKTRAALIAYENQIRGAENKVRSIDTAREAGDLTKFQILSQIATAMMAQANQLPAMPLQLIGGR